MAPVKLTWINSLLTVSAKKHILVYNFISANKLCNMPHTHFKSKTQNLKFRTLHHFRLPNGLTAVRPSSIMVRAPVFSHNKGNRIGFMKLLF